MNFFTMIVSTFNVIVLCFYVRIITFLHDSVMYDHFLALNGCCNIVYCINRDENNG